MQCQKDETAGRAGLGGSNENARTAGKDMRIWARKFYELQQRLGHKDDAELADIARWLGSRWMDGGPCDEKTISAALSKLAKPRRGNAVAAMVANGLMLFDEPAKSAMARIFGEMGLGKLKLAKNQKLVLDLWDFARAAGLVEKIRATTDGLFGAPYKLMPSKRKQPRDSVESPFFKYGEYVRDRMGENAEA